MEYIKIILDNKEVGIGIRKGAVVMALGDKDTLEDDIMMDILYNEITHEEYTTLLRTKYYSKDLFMSLNDGDYSLVTPMLLANIFTIFGAVFEELQ